MMAYPMTKAKSDRLPVE